MANIALDEIAEWLDELHPLVVSHFRSTGPSTGDLGSLQPTVQLYFYPTGSSPRQNFEPSGDGGGGGNGGLLLFPYTSF